MSFEKNPMRQRAPSLRKLHPPRSGMRMAGPGQKAQPDNLAVSSHGQICIYVYLNSALI